jgi:hypothetical protein
MSKFISPVDYDGEHLTIGSYVKYDGKTWEVVDHEDDEGPTTDDNYNENCILLLACRSHQDDNIWIPDYEVEITKYKQSYFEL